MNFFLTNRRSFRLGLRLSETIILWSPIKGNKSFSRSLNNVIWPLHEPPPEVGFQKKKKKIALGYTWIRRAPRALDLLPREAPRGSRSSARGARLIQAIHSHSTLDIVSGLWTPWSFSKSTKSRYTQFIFHQFHLIVKNAAREG